MTASMADHLRAARAAMPEGYPVDLFAPEPGRSGQWAVLEAPAWASDPDAPIGGDVGTIVTPIRLRVVTGTPEGVAVMLDRARQALSVGPLPVAGRVVWLTWERSEVIDLDRDVINPATSRHPAFGVDTYLLYSQAA